MTPLIESLIRCASLQEGPLMTSDDALDYVPHQVRLAPRRTSDDL